MNWLESKSESPRPRLLRWVSARQNARILRLLHLHLCSHVCVTSHGCCLLLYAHAREQNFATSAERICARGARLLMFGLPGWVEPFGWCFCFLCRCVCVCVCEREREREERERESVWMCVCESVCAGVYVCVCGVYVCVRVCVWERESECVRERVRVCVCLCLCVCVCVHVHVCACMQIYTHIRVTISCVCMSAFVYVCVRARACVCMCVDIITYTGKHYSCILQEHGYSGSKVVSFLKFPHECRAPLME